MSVSSSHVRSVQIRLGQHRELGKRGESLVWWRERKRERVGDGERGRRGKGKEKERHIVSYCFREASSLVQGLGKTEFRVLYHPALSTTWQGNKSLRAIMFSFVSGVSITDQDGVPEGEGKKG